MSVQMISHPMGGRAVEEWIASHLDQRVPDRIRDRIFIRAGGKGSARQGTHNHEHPHLLGPVPAITPDESIRTQVTNSYFTFASGSPVRPRRGSLISSSGVFVVSTLSARRLWSSFSIRVLSASRIVFSTITALLGVHGPNCGDREKMHHILGKGSTAPVDNLPVDNNGESGGG